MSVTTTQNLPPVIQGYANSTGDIDRNFFVEVGNVLYERIYLGRTHLQDANGTVIEDYLTLPAGIRTAFETMLYSDIKWHVRRLEKLIAESTEELRYLRDLRVE